MTEDNEFREAGKEINELVDLSSKKKTKKHFPEEIYSRVKRVEGTLHDLDVYSDNAFHEYPEEAKLLDKRIKALIKQANPILNGTHHDQKKQANHVFKFWKNLGELPQLICDTMGRDYKSATQPEIDGKPNKMLNRFAKLESAHGGIQSYMHGEQKDERFAPKKKDRAFYHPRPLSGLVAVACVFATIGMHHVKNNAAIAVAKEREEVESRNEKIREYNENPEVGVTGTAKIVTSEGKSYLVFEGFDELKTKRTVDEKITRIEIDLKQDQLDKGIITRTGPIYKEKEFSPVGYSIFFSWALTIAFGAGTALATTRSVVGLRLNPETWNPEFDGPEVKWTAGKKQPNQFNDLAIEARVNGVNFEEILKAERATKKATIEVNGKG